MRTPSWCTGFNSKNRFAEASHIDCQVRETASALRKKWHKKKCLHVLQKRLRPFRLLHDAHVFKRNRRNETRILLLFFSLFKTLNLENFLYQWIAWTPTHVASDLLLFCSAFIESQVERAFKWASAIQQWGDVVLLDIFFYWYFQFLSHRVQKQGLCEFCVIFVFILLHWPLAWTRLK